jgi:2-oxoglutarate ferredoxin oxidoreductase subunit delta
MTKLKAKKTKSAPRDSEPPVSFYPAWCKRCGNCVAFCPRKALEKDEWGSPFLAHPDKCTVCGLCEMLCPDFAISVGETTAPPAAVEAARKAGGPGTGPKVQGSPERLARASDYKED